MRFWKSESAQELRANSVRRSNAYGYCGYRELRANKRGRVSLATRRVTGDGSVEIAMERKADVRREEHQVGGEREWLEDCRSVTTIVGIRPGLGSRCWR